MFSRRLVSLCVGGALSCAAFISSSAASAAVISSWNFEGLTVSGTAAASPSPTAGTLASDTGNGAITGVHASNAVYSTPAGNGSPKSLSANTWSVGDYWEFTSNTTGFNGIMLLVDATGSNTGPRDFKVQYSTTGTGGAYTDLPGGSFMLVNSAFSSGTEQFTTPPRFLFDLSAITGLDNNASASFRLVDTSTVSINGGTVASGGTSRIDNVIVGTDLVIPEPATAAVITLLGAPMLAGRRRR
jgi:hypothetical protein